jgi:hypothetical protein
MFGMKKPKLDRAERQSPLVENKISVNIINNVAYPQCSDSPGMNLGSMEGQDTNQKVRGRKLQNQFSVFISDSSSLTDRGIFFTKY